MHGKVLVGLLVVLLVAAGCGGAGASTPATSNTPAGTTTAAATTTPSTKATTSPATSLNPNIPTPALLAKENFINPNIPRITCEEFKVMYDDNTPYSLVDTRLKTDFDDLHIRSARSIPNGDVNVVSQACLAGLKQLPKDKLLILYCD
jgi:ABC-type transport system substrate-binding protein